MKVGVVRSVKAHPNADKMYVEEIDVGEEKPRTICSGLKDYMEMDALKDKKLLVCTNLKPADLRGVVSEGMVLAAKTGRGKDDVKVELLQPAEDASVGDVMRVEDEVGMADKEISKSKLSKIIKFLKTNVEGCLTFKDLIIRDSKGRPANCSLTNADVS